MPSDLNIRQKVIIESPSEILISRFRVVQQECIPQAILGMDVLCLAKSGMGKTAVFVLASLQQLEIVEGEVSVLVLCHTHELAVQIKNEYDRFLNYMPKDRAEVVIGGLGIESQLEKLKTNIPNIIVATLGRLLALLKDKAFLLHALKCFILDECDRMIEPLGTPIFIHANMHF